MYVTIDFECEETLVFFVYDEDGHEHRFETGLNTEGAFVFLLEKVLKEMNKKISDLKGVAFRGGVGRFTVSRVAATFANTLSYCESVAVLSFQNEDKNQVIDMLKKRQPGIYASAVYSAEPRIGNK